MGCVTFTDGRKKCKQPLLILLPRSLCCPVTFPPFPTPPCPTPTHSSPAPSLLCYSYDFPRRMVLPCDWWRDFSGWNLIGLTVFVLVWLIIHLVTRLEIGLLALIDEKIDRFCICWLNRRHNLYKQILQSIGSDHRLCKTWT